MSLCSKGLNEIVSCVLLVSGWWFDLAASAVIVPDPPFGLFLSGNMVANVSLSAFVSALMFLLG